MPSSFNRRAGGRPLLAGGLWLTTALVALVLAYLLLWPVPIEPQAWTPPSNPGFTGAYAENQALADPQRLFADEIRGPAYLAVNEQGELLTGLADGRIVALDPADGAVRPLALSAGRPLGFVQTGPHRFVAANPLSGLAGTLKSEHFSLSQEADGATLGYPYGVALTARGALYFTDASARFGFGETYADLLEHGASGRLLRFDDLARSTSVVADGLYFPSGLALCPQEDCLLIAETSAYRVTRYWLSGAKAGRSEAFIENLPGLPAHLTWNGRDTWWLALYGPRIAAFDRFAGDPWLRKLIYRLPGPLRPQPERRAWVLGLDAQGRIVHNLQGTGAGAYAPVTVAREHAGWLYLGSQTEGGIARVPLPPRG